MTAPEQPSQESLTAGEEPRSFPQSPTAEEPPDPPGGPSAPPSGPGAATEAHSGQEGQPGRPVNREARYRTERNEARAQVAELSARVESMQSQEAARLAAEHLHNGGDLILFGYMTDVLAEDGSVDPRKVREACTEIIESRPGLAKGARRPIPDLGQGSYSGQSDGSVRSWSEVLRGD